MLVNDYPVMEKTVSAAWQLSEEEKIRQQIEMREEALRVRLSEVAEYERTAQQLKLAQEENIHIKEENVHIKEENKHLNDYVRNLEAKLAALEKKQ